MSCVTLRYGLQAAGGVAEQEVCLRRSIDGYFEEEPSARSEEGQYWPIQMHVLRRGLH